MDGLESDASMKANLTLFLVTVHDVKIFNLKIFLSHIKDITTLPYCWSLVPGKLGTGQLGLAGRTPIYLVII